MAESFIQTGDFFATSGVPRTENFKLERRYYSLINTTFWAIIVLVPMLYYLVKLLLSGSTVYFFIGVGIIILCKWFYHTYYMFIGTRYQIRPRLFGSYLNMCFFFNHSFPANVQNNWNVRDKQELLVRICGH